jgi:glutamate dehydrogenase
LLSREKYTCIIDGSGVLVDPQGINREELYHLAKARQMISHFDVSKLSKEGFRVLIDETDVKLPSGETIANGMTFRNTYHLRARANCFVPCGGRPEAVDLSNVGNFIIDGKCKIPYIVEGANLYFASAITLTTQFYHPRSQIETRKGRRGHLQGCERQQRRCYVEFS